MPEEQSFLIKHYELIFIVIGIVSTVVGMLIEHLRKGASETPTKLDDNLIKLYDLIKEQSKNEKFKILLKIIFESVSIKYKNGSIPANERRNTFMKILQEKIESGEVFELPPNWKKIVDEVIQELHMSEKYNKEVINPEQKVVVDGQAVFQEPLQQTITTEVKPVVIETSENKISDNPEKLNA
jgi:hypothetical protein